MTPLFSDWLVLNDSDLVPVVAAVTPDHLSPSLTTKLPAVFSCLFHFLILSPFHSSPSLLPLPLVPLSSSPLPCPISFSLRSLVIRSSLLPIPTRLQVRKHSTCDSANHINQHRFYFDSTRQECCSQRWHYISSVILTWNLYRVLVWFIVPARLLIHIIE